MALTTGGAAAIPATWVSAYDRYPDIPLWVYNTTFRIWFIVPADAPIKKVLSVNCVYPLLNLTAPSWTPQGCPDSKTTVDLDLASLLDLRSKDDARAWQPDPTLAIMAELAQNASPTKGDLQTALDRLRTLTEDPSHLFADLVDTALWKEMEKALGDDAWTYLFGDPADQADAARRIPDAPPSVAQAPFLLWAAEQAAHAKTGDPDPLTPQWPSDRALDELTKLPGFNPTYPRADSARKQDEDRRRFAYLYGMARGMYYKCPDLEWLNEIKSRIPEGFDDLYAMGLELAATHLQQLWKEMQQAFEDHDYDDHTCQPNPPTPEIGPSVPPEETPPYFEPLDNYCLLVGYVGALSGPQRNYFTVDVIGVPHTQAVIDDTLAFYSRIPGWSSVTVQEVRCTRGGVVETT